MSPTGIIQEAQNGGRVLAQLCCDRLSWGLAAMLLFSHWKGDGGAETARDPALRNFGTCGFCKLSLGELLCREEERYGDTRNRKG